MSDFDAKIVAIDSAMDALEGYRRELSDLRAHISFDMRSLFDKLDQEITRTRNEIEDIRWQIDAAQASAGTNQAEEGPNEASSGEQEELYGKLCHKQGVLWRLEQVMIQCAEYGSDLLGQFLDLNGACVDHAQNALHFMGNYIHDLNLICNREANELGTYRSADGYYVCVVDAALHPSTAEHIRAAQNMGHPAIVTIDRGGAGQRRTESLQNTPVRGELDRDEYPMALFSQGGSGADVAYLEGGDNRGCGAYISWQLRGVPDGAVVRIRVI